MSAQFHINRKAISSTIAEAGLAFVVCILSFQSSTIAQNVGIGSVSFVPVNMLDVRGNMVIGAGYAGTNAAPANGLLIQGNVGIGTTGPSEQLHVANNFRLGGAFMPGNLPGTSGQVLTSQGAAVAPIWSNASGSVVTVSQTSALAMTGTTTSFQQIPGLTYTLVLVSPSNVMIMTEGGVYSSSFGSIVDIAVLINGNGATNGGFQRVCATQYSAYTIFGTLITTIYQLVERWNINAVESLAAGTYTITVQARSGYNHATYNYPSTVGGTNVPYDVTQTTPLLESDSRKQGVLHIITF